MVLCWCQLITHLIHTHKHSENAVLANPSKKDSIAVTKKAVLDGINSMCVVIDQRFVHKVIYRERKLSCHINYCLMKCGVSKNTIELMFGSHLKFQFHLEHNIILIWIKVAVLCIAWISRLSITIWHVDVAVDDIQCDSVRTHTHTKSFESLICWWINDSIVDPRLEAS